MNEQMVDVKLKTLINLCKETGNYKKLSVEVFILTRNLIFEIAIKLGIRPIEFSPYKTIVFINSAFNKKLEITLFSEEQIDTIRNSEILFMRNKGTLPFDYIKAMFKLYYELREFDTPNLHKPSNLEGMKEATQGSLFSFLTAKSKSNDSNKLRPLIRQKIEEQEKNLIAELNSHFTAKKFESALYLKSLGNSLNNKKGNKITLQGTLKDNIPYQKSLESIFGYLIIGVIIALSSVGLIILLEMSMLPTITNFIDSWVLPIFVSVVLLFLVYYKFVKKEGI